ncbi:type II toxin-antitoxin system VapC family toxin [Frankia sp. Cr1]|uniref:type II toxin-antitoxin system VapC family toxin n=1 Tax=Frankia sp. Cr1 TaxID=3073931 RepID=UPI002AD1F2D0|nr:type II toxin-antitoxin system VapC family toxin [Frankia sp. Cr1]
MIVDSSALVAVVRAEPDAARYAAALVAVNRPAMSAANATLHNYSVRRGGFKRS